MTATVLPSSGRRPSARSLPYPKAHPLETLVARACAADPDPAAWQELINRFGRLLVHTARRVGLNESDAAEVAQLTWIRLWEHGHQIREPDSLASWLTATVRRESLRVAIRSRRFLLSADPSGEHGGGLPTAVSDVYPADGEYEPLLEQALNRLPTMYQQLLRLLMSDTCPSYLEVARILDLPVGSIGPMRMRALRMLRDTPELAGNARLYHH
jgi:RNA polymerase sigma factor (sigma-70 family)